MNFFGSDSRPILSSLIFAFSVNIDAFLVGMSTGIRKIHITIVQNLIISLISFAGTLLSLLLGRRILYLLPDFLTSCGGSILLFTLGIYYLYKALSAPDNSLHSESFTVTLSLKETFLLGAALSFNNIGIGIGASMSGIVLLPAALLTFLTSALFLSSGNILGNTSGLRLSNRYADLLSAIMLLLLGICNFAL